MESSNSGGQSTLALGYLIRDRDERGIVEPKGDDHGDLVDYVSIVDEEVQDLERIFREAIESNMPSNTSRGQKAFRGSKGGGGLGEQAFLQGGTELTTLEAEEGAVNLVGATKHPIVVGGKIFMRAEDILRDEGELQEVRKIWCESACCARRGKAARGADLFSVFRSQVLPPARGAWRAAQGAHA
ncbi:hypothetical protein L195_g042563 [Trifolium pratense]|uniref:Uncharacterized protein n=1 Tax=Trifolium pratense TaxID=57577 RepID=A0A2K3M6T4_TRIPR|nr:hypothetical protein L195_g042563 [Trifolium pratense]